MRIAELATGHITDHEEVVEIEFLAGGRDPRDRHVAFLGEVAVRAEQHDARFHRWLAHEDVLDVPVLPTRSTFDHQHAHGAIDDAKRHGGLVVRGNGILGIRDQAHAKLHGFAGLGRGDQDMRRWFPGRNGRAIHDRTRGHVHEFQPRWRIAQRLHLHDHRHLVAHERLRWRLNVRDRCIAKRITRTKGDGVDRDRACGQ